jgi:hypothetical protein
VPGDGEAPIDAAGTLVALFSAVLHGIVLLVPTALSLLAWAVILPLALGLIGRAVFFERDEDDIALPQNRQAVRAAATAEELQPEPDPVYQTPWPQLSSSATPVATPSPSAELPTPAELPSERIVYRGVRHDVDAVRAEVQKAWQRFTQRPTKRPEWRRYSDWSAPAPYALAGAAGASVESATLTVEPLPLATADPQELMAIWEAEILPDLRARFGANAFRTGASR